MAWSNSKIFRQHLADSVNRTAAFDLNADSFKSALYNNSITPDQNASAANTAYNAGQWASANEVSQVGQWAAGGLTLSSVAVDVGTSGVVFFDAADIASGSAATLTTYGMLIYDDTLTTPVADQGCCYNYFGGVQSVTAGTLTVIPSANGIMRYTL